MLGQEAADNGTVTVYVGGEEQWLRPRASRRWRRSAGRCCISAASAAGQIAKTINNMLLWACMAANFEALTLAKQLGADIPRLIEALGHGSGANWSLSRWGKSTGKWAEKDMDVALELAQARQGAGAARRAGRSADEADQPGQDESAVVVSRHAKAERNVMKNRKPAGARVRGCLRDDRRGAQQSPTKVRIAYDGFSMTSGPLIYADKQGIFKKFGLDVTPIFVDGGSMLTQAVVGGSVDIAQNGYTPALSAAVQGADIVIIGGISNKLPFQLVVKTSITNARAAQGPERRDQPLRLLDRHGRGLRAGAPRAHAQRRRRSCSSAAPPRAWRRP